MESFDDLLAAFLSFLLSHIQEFYLLFKLFDSSLVFDVFLLILLHFSFENSNLIPELGHLIVQIVHIIEHLWIRFTMKRFGIFPTT